MTTLPLVPNLTSDGAAKPSRRRQIAWAICWAFLIACLYLPSLGTRFDFIDDGNLVYPAPAMSPGDRLALMWRKVEANYQGLGPFRPVLWAHWEAAADLFQGSEFVWRLARLLWAGLAGA